MTMSVARTSSRQILHAVSSMSTDVCGVCIAACASMALGAVADGCSSVCACAAVSACVEVDGLCMPRETWDGAREVMRELAKETLAQCEQIMEDEARRRFTGRMPC